MGADSTTELFYADKNRDEGQDFPLKKIVTYPSDSGKITSTYEYFENTKLKTVSSKIRINQKQGGYFEGFTGNYREYIESGKLHLTGQYKMNRRIGMWKWYDDDGNLIKTKEEIFIYF